MTVEVTGNKFNAKATTHQKQAKKKKRRTTMTNAQIISLATAEFVENGALKLVDGIPEEIHTYEGWKERGFGVRKGEKSDIRITIWKHRTKKVKDKDGEETEKSSMFLKESAFFRRSQVDEISKKNQSARA